jgi:uncharacterized membrane protein
MQKLYAKINKLVLTWTDIATKNRNERKAVAFSMILSGLTQSCTVMVAYYFIFFLPQQRKLFQALAINTPAKEKQALYYMEEWAIKQ